MESLLLRWALADNKPVFGICRGIQLINAALGGTLYQDIQTEFAPKGASIAHDNDRWTALPHHVELTRESQLHRILGDGLHAVNSVHHQAVRQPAPGARVTARAEDGLIEGLELPQYTFAVAVQWHPEVLWQDGERKWLKLFEAFVAQAQEFAAKRS